MTTATVAQVRERRLRGQAQQRMMDSETSQLEGEAVSG